MLIGITPRICEIGKIKIGCLDPQERVSRSGKPWRPPKKLDYFVITTLERDKKGDLLPDMPLMNTLGGIGKVREIPIVVLSDEIDEIVPAQYCWYNSKKIVARCDGKQCFWFQNKEGQPLDPPRATDCNGEHTKENWKPHATFHCVIATQEARWGGVYKFRTTSKISLEQLYGSLLHLKQLTNGILQGLPLKLVMRPMQVTPLVNGQRISTTVYVVHVELRGADLAQLQQNALAIATSRVANVKQIREVQAQYYKLLAAPENPIEQADIADEFHPPSEEEQEAQPSKEEVEQELSDQEIIDNIWDKEDEKPEEPTEKKS